LFKLAQLAQLALLALVPMTVTNDDTNDHWLSLVTNDQPMTMITPIISANDNDQ